MSSYPATRSYRPRNVIRNNKKPFSKRLHTFLNIKIDLYYACFSFDRKVFCQFKSFVMKKISASFQCVHLLLLFTGRTDTESGAVNAKGRKRPRTIMIIFNSTTNCTRVTVVSGWMGWGEVDFCKLFYHVDHVLSRWITCDINQHNLENSFSSESQRVVCVTLFAVY